MVLLLIFACVGFKVVSSVEAAPVPPFTWPAQYSAASFVDPNGNNCPAPGSVSDEIFLKHCNVPYGSVQQQGQPWYHEFPDPAGGDMKFYDACYHGACNYKDPTAPARLQDYSQEQLGRYIQAMLACLSGRNKCLQLMANAPIGQNVGFETTQKRMEVVNQHLEQCNNYYASAHTRMLQYFKKDDAAKQKLAERSELIKQWMRNEKDQYIASLQEPQRSEFANAGKKEKGTWLSNVASQAIQWGACSECEAVEQLIEAQAGTPAERCNSANIESMQVAHAYVMELVTNLLGGSIAEEAFVSKEQGTVSFSKFGFLLICVAFLILLTTFYRPKGDALEEEYNLLDA